MQDDNQKYYRTIPIVPKETEPVDPAHAHWHFSKKLTSGRIRGTFTTLQPLHVGTGQYVPPPRLDLTDEAPLVKSFYRAGDRITVPGSSLKGAVRSVVEAITYSAVSKTRARLNRKQYGESQYNSRRKEGDLDVAGKLFGAMGYLGHVRFDDAPLLEGSTMVQDIPPQYQPRASEGRRYYPHHLKDGREPLWPLEVVAAGGRFAFLIHYENLTVAELGLILIVLGQNDPPLCIKLGAGKNSGLGALRFQEVIAEEVEAAASYEAYETLWQPVDLQSCVSKALNNLVRRDNTLQHLQADLGCASLE